MAKKKDEQPKAPAKAEAPVDEAKAKETKVEATEVKASGEEKPAFEPGKSEEKPKTATEKSQELKDASKKAAKEVADKKAKVEKIIKGSIHAITSVGGSNNTKENQTKLAAEAGVALLESGAWVIKEHKIDDNTYMLSVNKK